MCDVGTKRQYAILLFGLIIVYSNALEQLLQDDTLFDDRKDDIKTEINDENIVTEGVLHNIHMLSSDINNKNEYAKSPSISDPNVYQKRKSYVKIYYIILSVFIYVHN